MHRASVLLSFLLLLAIPIPAAAQPSTSQPGTPAPIQDNSFLIEEAYNQEDGVVQHISSFERLTNSRDWIYTQTDEWPLRSYKHQVSITVAGMHAGDYAHSGAGWGDTAVNYRYQLVGSGDNRLAIAPRLSLLLPTGDYRLGRSAGGTGLQANLPVSIQHSSRLVTHWNAGLTSIPRALDDLGHAASTTHVNLGQSTVWLMHPRANVLVETLWTSRQRVLGADKTEQFQELYVSPGFRWAHNFRSGLQIVPGFAFPIGIGPSAGEKGVLLYLSFEHPWSLAGPKSK